MATTRFLYPCFLKQQGHLFSGKTHARMLFRCSKFPETQRSSFLISTSQAHISTMQRCASSEDSLQMLQQPLSGQTAVVGLPHNDIGWSIRRKSSAVTSSEKLNETSKISMAEMQTATDNDTSQPFTQTMFDDFRAAYSAKTLWELVRARSIFYLCSFSYLTNNAEKMMALSRRILGRRLSKILIGRTVYDHFVGGDDVTSIQKVALRLREAGLGSLLAVSIEDDVGNADSENNQQLLDDNLAKILKCIELSRQLGEERPMFQLKGTALMTGNLMKAVSECCGDIISPAVLTATADAMEGAEVDFSKFPGWGSLSVKENDEFLVALRRFQTVNKAVISGDVIAMMDAEYTYLNPALRLIALAMMVITSQDKSRVFYTYQAYLKQTLDFLKADLALSRSLGFCFGAKLVRGAYLVKERQRAKDFGYPDPVQDDFRSTCNNYHMCLDQLLLRAAEDDASIRFIIASHNEESITYALNRMSSLGLKPWCDSVIFGQLYGMADHVSYTLGRLGYFTVKSVPFGSLEETLPYLARRAQENKSVLENARRERELLAKALGERLLWRKSPNM